MAQKNQQQQKRDAAKRAQNVEQEAKSWNAQENQQAQNGALKSQHAKQQENRRI